METNTIVKPRVKGHGSFILRDGWINKALSELVKDGNERVFNAPDATDIFGIGSNMVPALKYWMQCFRLVDNNTSKGIFLSELGQVIYENDRYLEDIFTVWLLHSNIVHNYEKASLIHDYFNDEKIQTISKESLLEAFVRKWEQFGLPEKSIESDVTILFNTYCKEKQNDDPEDKIVSPLNELGLIKKDNDGNYSKIQPDLRLLPDETILFELSNIFDGEYSLKAEKAQRRSISIERVATGQYSLGAVYNLSKVATNQMLNRLQNLKYITVDRTAGLDVIYDEGIPSPIEIVKEYYSQR